MPTKAIDGRLYLYLTLYRKIYIKPLVAMKTHDSAAAWRIRSHHRYSSNVQSLLWANTQRWILEVEWQLVSQNLTLNIYLIHMVVPFMQRSDPSLLPNGHETSVMSFENSGLQDRMLQTRTANSNHFWIITNRPAVRSRPGETTGTTAQALLQAQSP